MALTQIKTEGIAANAITEDRISSAVSLGGPKISNVQIANSSWSILDDTAVDVNGGYVIINGSGFTSGCGVIIGTQNASAVTYIDSSTLRVQVGSQTAGTKTIYVVNQDGGTAIGLNGLTYSAFPAWVTGSTLNTQTFGLPISVQLQATGATAYSLQGGSALPANVTLSSAGLISGTTNAASNTTYSFTVVATDAENQDSPRTFSMPIVTQSPSIYVKLWGSSTNTFIDSSTYNHTVTRVGTAIIGTTSTTKVGGSAIQIQNNDWNHQLVVDISNRGVYLQSSNWRLGYWGQLALDANNPGQSLVALGNNASRGILLGMQQNTGSSTAGFIYGSGGGYSNANRTLAAPTRNSWFYYELYHVAGQNTASIKMYNALSNSAIAYVSDVPLNAGDQLITNITINFYATATAGYVDSLTFSADSSSLGPLTVES